MAILCATSTGMVLFNRKEGCIYTHHIWATSSLHLVYQANGCISLVYQANGWISLVYQANGCISLVYHDRRVFLACNALLGYPGMTSNFLQLIPKLVCTK